MAWKSAIRLPNWLRSFGVGDRRVERALSDAEGLRTDRRTGVVEGLQGGLEAGALGPDDPVAGDAAVLEVQLGGRRAADAELLLVGADDEARVVLVDHEGADRGPLEGSVTAMTVYHVDQPPLVIQHLLPLRTQSSPSRTAAVVIAPASEPASRSLSAYDAIASPLAMEGGPCA